MNNIKNIGRHHHFYDYHDKGNDTKRLRIILLIFAFLLCPPFAFFFKWVGAPNTLFVSMLSVTIAFPLMLVLERFIPFCRGKLPILYFLFFNSITIYSLIDLHQRGYLLFEGMFFIGLFAMLNFAIQRFYLSLIYFLNTLFTLLIANWLFPVGMEIKMEATLTLLICIGVFYLIIYYSRNSMIDSIQDHNKYLKRIVNNLGHGVILFQLRGSFISVVDFNQEIISLLQDDNIDAIEEKFGKKIDPDDVQALLDLYDEQYYVKQLDFDDKRIVEVKITRVKLKNGTYYIATLQDITEKIEENNLIKQNEKKYKNLFIRNLTGVFTLSLSGAVIDCNPAFLKLFKKESADELRLFSDQSEWNELRDNLRKKETITNYNKIYLSENDREVFVVFNFYFDYELNTIEGNVVDITEITLSAKALRENENKYRSIYEESNDSILLLDEDRIMGINQQGIKLLGKEQDEIVEMSLWDFSYNQTPELKKQYDAYFAQLKEKKAIRFPWVFSKNDTFMETSVSIVELKLDQELLYQCVIHNETERNRNIRALESSKKTFESIIENTPEGFLILQGEKCLYASSEFYRILAIEDTKPGELAISEHYFGTNYQRIEKLIGEHLQDKKTKQKQLKFALKDKTIEIDLTVVSIIFEEKEAVMLILKDVSFQNKLSKETLRAEILEDANKRLEQEIEERKAVELKLESEYLRTKAIFDSSLNTLLLTLTPDLKLSSFNQQSKLYCDYQTKKELAKGIDFESYFEQIISPIKLRYFKYLLSSVRKGKAHQFELKFINIYNEKKWIEIFLNPILDVNGVLTEFSMVAHDITDKKRAEKEILLSLKEKEVLLKEVHHRVKNNLQIISSILNLQTSYIEDEKILEIIEESRHRIRSMAIIHENLYQNTNFSSINFKNYSRELVRNLISSYQFSKDLEVDLQEDVEHVELNLDQAIPCGLIINELITNSMKYAFTERKKGTIYLELKNKNNIITLVVGDDGVGLPKDYDINNAETLGLQLVATLAEQLDGDINLEKTKGIKYFITFEKQKL